jgi:hypothetical protein
MSRMIRRDQRSPSISTEAFKGQPDRRFVDVLFLGIQLHHKLLLAYRKLNMDTVAAPFNLMNRADAD